MLSPSIWMDQINFQGDIIVTRQMIAASWGKPEVYYHVVVKSAEPVD